MLLEQGYNDLGIQALLEATGTPEGLFYHHFNDKEDFALQVIDQYMQRSTRVSSLPVDAGRPPSTGFVTSSRRRTGLPRRATWAACSAGSARSCPA